MLLVKTSTQPLPRQTPFDGPFTDSEAPAAAGPKKSDYYVLLAGRKGKVETRGRTRAYLDYPFSGKIGTVQSIPIMKACFRS